MSNSISRLSRVFTATFHELTGRQSSRPFSLSMFLTPRAEHGNCTNPDPVKRWNHKTKSPLAAGSLLLTMLPASGAAEPSETAIAYPNATDNPRTRQRQWGPPVSPIKGRDKCPHGIPKRRRWRYCRECGFYTIKQAQNGGIVSGRVRRDRRPGRDRRIQGCKGRMSAPATAKRFGLSVRQIWRIWARPRIPAPATAQQLAAWRRAQLETVTRTYLPVARHARQAIVKLICWRWQAQQQRDRADDDRLKRRFLSLVRKCSGEISRYGRAVRQMDGQAKWDSILADSRTVAARHWEYGAAWLKLA